MSLRTLYLGRRADRPLWPFIIIPPGVSQDASSQYRDGNAQSTSLELGPDGLSQRSRKDGEHDGGERVHDLEKDMLTAFKDQEDMLSANSPTPQQTHCLDNELAAPKQTKNWIRPCRRY